jgi:ketosteroid isomerase-like protein
MAEHPNATLVRQWFTALGNQDNEAAIALMSDEAVWHTSGRGRFAGDYEGKESVSAYLNGFGMSVDSIVDDLHSVLADDEHAVALNNSTLTRGDKTLNQSNVFVFHVAAGQITEVWVSFLYQYENDEFFAV